MSSHTAFESVHAHATEVSKPSDKKSAAEAYSDRTAFRPQSAGTNNGGGSGSGENMSYGPPANSSQLSSILHDFGSIKFTTAAQDKASGQQPDYYLDPSGHLHANPNAKSDSGTIDIEIASKNKSELDAKKLADKNQRDWAKEMIAKWKADPSNKGKQVPSDWENILSTPAPTGDTMPNPPGNNPAAADATPAAAPASSSDTGSSASGGSAGGGYSGGDSGGGSGGGGYSAGDSSGGGGGDSSAGGSPGSYSGSGGSIDTGTSSSLPNINAPDLSKYYQYPITGEAMSQPERIDQGVDFGGTGQFHAIGNSVVDAIIPNWYQGQPLVEMTLTDGPLKGAHYYVAEGIQPLVHVGQQVSKGEVIANITGGPTGIETGWGAGGGKTLAQATTGYTEGQQTAAGTSYSQFLQKLGGPGGR